MSPKPDPAVPTRFAGAVRRLEVPEERQEAASLERHVFSPDSRHQDPKPPSGKKYTEYGAFEDGRLVGMTGVNNEPLKGWRGPTLDKLRALEPVVLEGTPLRPSLIRAARQRILVDPGREKTIEQRVARQKARPGQAATA